MPTNPFVNALRDPYAAIRTLNFSKTPGAEQFHESENGSTSMGFSPDSWSTDFDALRSSGFQSKYNQVEQQPDGTLAVTMQQPGGHKYDTMQVIYAQDANGQWQMRDGHATRQKGSGLSAKVYDELVGLSLNENYAAGLSGGPGSVVAMGVQDAARGIQSSGMGGTVGRFNDEVLRNAKADTYNNARAASRAAAVASMTGGAGALAGALGGGAAGGAGSGALFGGAAQAQGSGADILRGAAVGGIAGGIRGYMQTPTAVDAPSFDGAPTNDFFDIPQSEFTWPSFTGAPTNDFFDIPQSEFTAPSFTGAPTNDFFDIPQSEFNAQAPLPTDPIELVEVRGKLDPVMWQPGIPTPAFPPNSDPDFPAQTVEVTGQRPENTTSGGLPTLPLPSSSLPVSPIISDPLAPIPEPLDPPGVPQAGPPAQGGTTKPPYRDLLKLLTQGLGGGGGGVGYAPIRGTAASRALRQEDPLPKLFDPNYRKPQMKETDVY